MLGPGLSKLVVDALAKFCPSKLDLGDGTPGATLLSLSFDSPRFLGLEKSFIFELLALGSFSGGKPGGGAIGKGGAPGDGRGLLPFGNATFAAVAAASLLPPSVPLWYCNPPAELT